MKPTVLRAIAAGILLGCMTPGTAEAQPDPPERQASSSPGRNFSGTWVPDRTRSEMVGRSRGAPSLVVTQTADEMVFGAERYRLDGSASTGESHPGYRPESETGWALLSIAILASPALFYFLSSRNKSAGEIVLAGILLCLISAGSNLMVMTSRGSTAGLAYFYLLPLQFLAVPLGYVAGGWRRFRQPDGAGVGGREKRWLSRNVTGWFRWAVLVIVVAPPAFMAMRPVFRGMETGPSFTTTAQWSGNALVVTSVGRGSQSYTRIFTLTLTGEGNGLTTQTVITVEGRERHRSIEYWIREDPRTGRE